MLNAPAVAVLSNLSRVGVYVIAGDSAGTKDEKPRSDLKRPWAMVTRHAGLAGLRIHDLRHNFASFGAGGGMGLPIIGKLLGHKQAATTQRYAHLDADPLRRASNAIGNTIAAAMGEQPCHRRTSFRSSLARGDRTRRNRATIRQAGEHLPVSPRSPRCSREVREVAYFSLFQWPDPTTWPNDFESHVFLARGLDHIGRAKFGDKWVGDETAVWIAFKQAPWKFVGVSEGPEKHDRFAQVTRYIVKAAEEGALLTALRE